MSSNSNQFPKHDELLDAQTVLDARRRLSELEAEHQSQLASTEQAIESKKQDLSEQLDQTVSNVTQQLKTVQQQRGQLKQEINSLHIKFTELPVSAYSPTNLDQSASEGWQEAQDTATAALKRLKASCNDIRERQQSIDEAQKMLSYVVEAEKKRLEREAALKREREAQMQRYNLLWTIAQSVVFPIIFLIGVYSIFSTITLLTDASEFDNYSIIFPIFAVTTTIILLIVPFLWLFRSQIRRRLVPTFPAYVEDDYLKTLTYGELLVGVAALLIFGSMSFPFGAYESSVSLVFLVAAFSAGTTVLISTSPVEEVRRAVTLLYAFGFICSLLTTYLLIFSRGGTSTSIVYYWILITALLAAGAWLRWWQVHQRVLLDDPTAHPLPAFSVSLPKLQPASPSATPKTAARPTEATEEEKAFTMVITALAGVFVIIVVIAVVVAG